MAKRKNIYIEEDLPWKQLFKKRFNFHVPSQRKHSTDQVIRGRQKLNKGGGHALHHFCSHQRMPSGHRQALSVRQKGCPKPAGISPSLTASGRQEILSQGPSTIHRFHNPIVQLSQSETVGPTNTERKLPKSYGTAGLGRVPQATSKAGVHYKSRCCRL